MITIAIQVNTHEAKTHLSKLLVRVQAGEEIVIAKAGIPIARLIAVDGTVDRRVPGTAKDRIIIRTDFDEALPNEVLDAFDQ